VSVDDGFVAVGLTLRLKKHNLPDPDAPKFTLRFLEPVRSFAEVDTHDQRKKIPEVSGVRRPNV
jgi:hypothetical protein